MRAATFTAMARNIFLLGLICSVPVHAARRGLQRHSVLNKIDSTSENRKALITTGANATANSTCFGLCIGSVILLSVLGGGSLLAAGTAAIAVSLRNNENVNYLTAAGVTDRDVAAIAAQAPELAVISQEDIEARTNLSPHLSDLSTEEIKEHAEAVVAVTGMPEKILQHMAATCGRSVMPKDLGESDSSSRSGATFFNCATPGERGLMLHVGDELKAVTKLSKKRDYTGQIGTVELFGKIPGGAKRVQIKWGEAADQWTTHSEHNWWKDFEQLSNVAVDDQKLPRVLLKGGIRDTSASPEWSAFETMAPRLHERYNHGTLLNKMITGFTAFNLHWMALEDIKSDPLIHRLEDELGIQSNEALKWNRFDVKPAGSRAPQLGPCFQEMILIAKDMGPINQFKGWDRMVIALGGDLEFLEEHNVIDESLLIQTVGPFKSNRAELSTLEEEAILDIFGGAPMCAFQHKDGNMAIVCITVLDYVLSLSVSKRLQNVIQASRWTDYSQKLSDMMHCVGDLNAEGCSTYRSAAEGHWQEIITQHYDEMSQESRDLADAYQKDWTCCCNTGETTKKFTMETMCAWMKKTSWYQFSCPKDLDKVEMRQGGCLDIDFPVETTEGAVKAPPLAKDVDAKHTDIALSG